MAIRAVSFLRLLVAVWLLCEVFAQRSADRNNRRLATRNRLRSGEGTCRRDLFRWILSILTTSKLSNTAKFNTPLKKYLVSRTQFIPSVLFMGFAVALQAKSLLTFTENSGKWKANKVFAILVGYFFCSKSQQIADLCSLKHEMHGKYSTPLTQNGIKFNSTNTESFYLLRGRLVSGPLQNGTCFVQACLKISRISC